MRRAPSLSDPAPEEKAPGLTSMIDVTFLLLVFFLCTLQFKTLEGKLAADLPRDAGKSTRLEERERVEIEILIDAPGRRVNAANGRTPDRGQAWTDPERRYELVGRRVHYRVGPRRTADLQELRGWLVELARGLDEPACTIQGRAGCVYGDVVRVLDTAIEAGFDGVTFAGEPGPSAK